MLRILYISSFFCNKPEKTAFLIVCELLTTNMLEVLAKCGMAFAVSAILHQVLTTRNIAQCKNSGSRYLSFLDLFSRAHARWNTCAFHA